jgi:hypothetical protein
VAPWQHIRPILVALVDLDQEEAIEAVADVQRMLKRRRRGGDLCAEQRADRNSVYHDLAVSEYGTASLTPKQAKALNRKVGRLLAEAHLIEGGGSVQQDAVRRIRAAGLDPVGPRQILRILNEPKKKL